jgi:haloacetate dehalogenase
MSDLFPGFAVERRVVNGIRINVRHGGHGPPLLLIHGFPQSHAIWHRVAAPLAERYSLVMPDLRGYGDSDKPTSAPDHEPYSKRAMAQDMVELMQSLAMQLSLSADTTAGDALHTGWRWTIRSGCCG